MIDRIRAAIPPALLLAFALAVFGDTSLSLYQAHLSSIRNYDQVRDRLAGADLAALALWLTTTLLIASGFGELRARLRGDARALMTVATVVAGLALVRPVMGLYLTYVDQPRGGWLRDYYLWSGRVSFAAWLAAAGCMAALTARRGAVGLAIGVALLVTTAISHPLRTLAEWLYFDSDLAHPWANATLGIAYQVASVGALGAAVFLIGEDAAPVPAEPVRLVAGLERIGTALVARVVLAIGVATFTLMAIGAKSPGLGKLLVTVGPAALLATAIAQVSGLFTAARDGAAPRLRLVAAGALTLLTMTATACQAVAAYRVARDRWSRGDMDSWDRHHLEAAATALPNLIPLVGLAGLLLLLSAIASVRARRPAVAASTPGSAAAWVVGGTLAALFLQRYALRDVHDVGEFVMLTLLVATANVIATIAVARCCHQTAWAFRTLDPDALPAARLVDRNPM